MKVYFTHSTRNTTQYQAYYDTVKTVIEQLNHELIHHSPTATHITDSIKMSSLYSKMMKEIQNADLCIFDTK